MDFLSSSMFDPFCSQNNPDLSTQILAEGDIFTQQNELHNFITPKIPTFIDDDETLNANPKKRSFALFSLNDQLNGDLMKKNRKIIHREVERQRRFEMSSLHSSLKSLLPLQYTKGKRSISDHLDEAVKYIKHMQQKIQALSDQRDGLRKEVPYFKGHEYDDDDDDDDDDDVIVNVFNGSLEVIVSTCCGNENDNNSNQSLPLSKVLRCLFQQQGLDVVSSFSKKVNSGFVHCIHLQVGQEDSNAIDAIILKKKLAAINR